MCFIPSLTRLALAPTFYVLSCFAVLFVLIISLLRLELNFDHLLSHTSQQRIARLVIVLSVVLRIFLINFLVYAYRQRCLLPPTIFFNIGFAISPISGATTEPSRPAIGKNPPFVPFCFFIYRLCAKHRFLQTVFFSF